MYYSVGLVKFNIVILVYLTQALRITEGMVKYLEGDDDKEIRKYTSALFFLIDHYKLHPLVIAMLQKFQELCPDKLEYIKEGGREVSAVY